jgi:2-polyprenyl-6-methoxyphenol hydroxylase-like FAD-dependent oxidoreductase
MTHHALVLGGSMNGLLAAAALAPHFERVTIVERAEALEGTSPRQHVPQGQHVHALLTSGSAAIEKLLPGFGADLRAAGAVQVDMSADIAWYHSGVWKLACETAFRPFTMSRPLLESRVRALTLALPNVTLVTGVKVERLLGDAGHVRGAELSGARNGPLEADLVIDATGRGSQLPKWLEQLGAESPKEAVIDLGLAYTSAVFRRDPAVTQPWKILIVYPRRPDHRRSCLLFPMEGNRWHLSLGGYSGDHAPTDREGFLDFVKSLDRPEPWTLVKDLTMLEEPVRTLVPKQVRRHFERLTRPPAGIIALGDSFCAFDPVFGQGMSVGAREAVLLKDLLTQGRFSPGTFYREASRLIDAPWLIATSEAFRYPATTGPRPLGGALPLLHAFLGRVFQKCGDDAFVLRAFLAVMNLEKSPFSLFNPRVLWHLALPVRRPLDSRGLSA